ncbi:tyrosine-type recombinase/integrase [Hyphomicrobium denitrificans]|nr:tyrosine-type recombinase/integrase [Hyphomicrobium denitrificans]
MARTLGVSYRAVNELAEGDLSEIVRRVALLEEKNLTDSPPAAAAVLGAAKKPSILISQLFEKFEEHGRDRLRGKSVDQVRKWKNPRIRAVNNFVEVVGDKTLESISRDDGLDFRAWWLDRVLEEDYDPGSANKDLGHLKAMFQELDLAWRLKLDNPFAGLRVSGEKHNKRTAYSAKFVRENFLAGDRLSNLNAEARAITVMVAMTGMRPSEVAALSENRVFLQANIPYVSIKPEARQLKTRHSERDMPLVGLALETMREFKAGFPRYRDAPDTLSATVNKALSESGLRPTPEYTLYSLRHTFKDRLIALEAPQRVQDALMGHAVREVEYGSGPSLEQRATWIARVWGAAV